MDQLVRSWMQIQVELSKVDLHQCWASIAIELLIKGKDRIKVYAAIQWCPLPGPKNIQHL